MQLIPFGSMTYGVFDHNSDCDCFTAIASTTERSKAFAVVGSAVQAPFEIVHEVASKLCTVTKTDTSIELDLVFFLGCTTRSSSKCSLNPTHV